MHWCDALSCQTEGYQHNTYAFIISVIHMGTHGKSTPWGGKIQIISIWQKVTIFNILPYILVCKCSRNAFLMNSEQPDTFSLLRNSYRALDMFSFFFLLLTPYWVLSAELADMDNDANHHARFALKTFWLGQFTLLSMCH